MCVIWLRAGTIWYHTGRYVYNIASADAGSDSVRDIRVFERNEGGRLVRLIQASRARRIAPHEWRFEDATVRRFDPSQPTAPPNVERAREIANVVKPQVVDLLADRDRWRFSRHGGLHHE